MTAHDVPRSHPGAEGSAARLAVDRLTLAASTASIPVARAFVRGTVANLPATMGEPALVPDPAAVVDLELCASELVTNAIEHATGPTVEVALAADGDTAVLSVTSRGNADAVGPAGEWQVAAVESVTGRGLGIVRALADRVTTWRRGDELMISVERTWTARSG